MANAEPLEPDPGHAGEGTETPLAFSRISIGNFGLSEGGRSLSCRMIQRLLAVLIL